MPVYTYKAKNKEGKIITGSVEASNSVAAASVVSQRGWITISVSEKREILALKPLTAWLGGVSPAARSVFTRQLATMIGAGLPLTQSLEILYKQETNQKLKEIIEELYHDVESGMTLSQSLSKYPHIFKRLYVNLIKAGEASGSLDKILTRLAENEEKNRDFNSKVRGAFVYPVIVISFMILVFIIMMVFVIPRLVVLYRDIGTDLPLPTKILIWISDLMTKRFYLPLGLAFALVAGFRYFSSTDFGTKWISDILFKLPVLGNLRKQTELVEFARTLSLLVASGIPILDSLSIVREGMNDPIYRQALKEAADQVERGVNLSTPLKADPTKFPPILSQMIAIGEETGRLDEMLLKVSVFFENETEMTLKTLTIALEPAIMIVLGIVVAFLVISIIMPIYKLTAQL